jgi:hypothetical protein
LNLDAAIAPVIAADFVTGAAPSFARICSAKGDVLEIVRRVEGESLTAFQNRASGLTEACGAPRRPAELTWRQGHRRHS